MIILTLGTRKLKFGVKKSIVQVHMARKQHSWDPSTREHEDLLCAGH